MAFFKTRACSVVCWNHDRTRKFTFDWNPCSVEGSQDIERLRANPLLVECSSGGEPIVPGRGSIPASYAVFNPEQAKAREAELSIKPAKPS